MKEWFTRLFEKGVVSFLSKRYLPKEKKSYKGRIILFLIIVGLLAYLLS